MAVAAQTRYTLRWAVIVLLLGGVLARMFPYIGPAIGDPWFWIAIFAVTGTLFVIPTAGEVPIVQAMLALGLGVGPAAALLMTRNNRSTHCFIRRKSTA
jgi:uncharacterized protein